MEFIDHTGHIFSLPHYNNYPNGYQYDEQIYTFWMNDEYNNNLSVGCYYIKPIKMLIDKKTLNNDELGDVTIQIESSNVFRLLSPLSVQNKIQNNSIENIFNDIEFNEGNFNNGISSDFKTILTSDDIVVVQNLKDKQYIYKDKSSKKSFKYVGDIFTDPKGQIYGKLDNDEIIYLTTEETEYYLIPFYVIGFVKDEGSWMTNVLIHVKSKIDTEIYCPIMVGGSFYDEHEELTINGQNIGLSLPKDVIRSIYNTRFFNDTPDLNTYNQKIREYLVNHMLIRSERGNFRSAIAGLKWFGYGDKLNISKLLQTDNEIQNQFILDNFNISSDIIESYKFFRNSTYLSLGLNINQQTGELDPYKFDEVFVGENKPLLENLFDKIIYNVYDETNIKFYRTYFEHTFNELGLKLSCLKYYYQKYFLPIHLKVFRASLNEQVYANNIKLLSCCKSMHVEAPLFIKDDNVNVKFPKTNVIWFNEQIHFVDEYFNEYSNTYKLSLKYGNGFNSYYIDDLCCSIPIKFINKSEKENTDSNYIFNCNLFLYKDNELILNNKFSFAQEHKYIKKDDKYIYDEENSVDYENLVLYPKIINKNQDINFWLNSKYTIKLFVNDVWFEYGFELKMPEIDIKIGKLEYIYNYDICKQFSGIIDNKIQWNAEMYLPELMSINNIDYIDLLISYMKENNIRFISEENLSDKVYYYFMNENNKKVIISKKFEGVTLEEMMFNGKKTYYLTYENIKYSINKDVNNILYAFNESLKTSYPIYSSIYSNIESLVKIYEESINISDSNNYLNVVHMFDIYKYDEQYSEYKKIPFIIDNENLSTEGLTINEIKLQQCYNKNISEEVISLYKEFFDENGNWKNEYYDFNNYDFYLMHDYEFWYGILISKYPIGALDKRYINLGSQKPYFINDNKMCLKYVRSDKKLLINRLNYIDAKGIHQFKDNDLLVAYVDNFERLPIKSKIGSKWKVSPISIGIDNYLDFESSTNMTLISIGDNIKYEPGYYEVEVSYSIDNFINHTQERSTKFLIKKQ